MSNLKRSLSGNPLHFRLGESGRAEFIDQDLLARSGRSARTLVKDGPLRVTLVALAPGGALTEHRAEGPITVHVLSGDLRFTAEGNAWLLESGDLFSLGTGVPHAVESDTGGVFLLTVALVAGHTRRDA